MIERDPRNANYIRTLDKLDGKRMQMMLEAEDKCRKYYTGGVDYSVEVNKRGALVRFINMAIKFQNGGKVSRRKMERLLS